MTVHEKIIRALERVPNMEKAIEYMRTYDFRFFEGTLLFPVEMERERRYSWMIRKMGKKWDKSLMIGIKLWGKKNHKVIIIQGGMPGIEDYQVIKKPWKDEKDFNFKRSVVTLEFPKYLHYDERRKWRSEHHRVKRDKNYIPSEWYKKILPDVIFIPKHKQRVAHG